MSLPAASAHRLDEYLQAALISVDSGRVQAEIRLVPGVAVLPVVMAEIDRDGDGRISADEQRDYAARFLRDVSFAIDGERLRPRLVSSVFPSVEEVRDGMGEIRLTVDADVPRAGGERRLVFENRHQSRIGAYLVNSLVPADARIQIEQQKRNYSQSVYELDYRQAGVARPWLRSSAWLALVGALLSLRLVFLGKRRADVHPSI